MYLQEIMHEMSFDATLSKVQKEQRQRRAWEEWLSSRKPTGSEGGPKLPRTGRARCRCVLRSRGGGCVGGRISGFCVPDFSDSVCAAAVSTLQSPRSPAEVLLPPH